MAVSDWIFTKLVHAEQLFVVSSYRQTWYPYNVFSYSILHIIWSPGLHLRATSIECLNIRYIKNTHICRCSR